MKKIFKKLLTRRISDDILNESLEGDKVIIKVMKKKMVFEN
ncbi:hypothetical protein CNEO2_2370001 [Clostridium neonatale]|nr:MULTISPECIES: hypothetical protein [Clostridium]CAG9714078.1 conserved hypothetical protein [Clostridium neonatale]CAI3198899.1 hypothetical protein CNEO2_2270001 [Clostridium neonatale]CAI3553264.1 hypothetical protein CNEO4_1150001 [Clostridium neonatale]CAI3563644.1 hypothetical protein CNEO3_1840001 [Clostridium neonatale]CAI3587485.1 hypothetical protein CNEO3_2090001 [Clostridium neonatale]